MPRNTLILLEKRERSGRFALAWRVLYLITPKQANKVWEKAEDGTKMFTLDESTGTSPAPYGGGASQPSGPGTGRLWLAIGALGLIAVVAIVFGYQAGERNQALTTQVKALNQTVELMNRRLAQSDESYAQMQGELSAVTKRLKLSQGEIANARAQTKKVRAEQEDSLKQLAESVNAELTRKADLEKVEELSGNVTGVRKDLDDAKGQWQMSRGELGTLIARNHEEIEQLRRLGHRDYFEFDLSGKGGRTRVGTVVLELRGTNTKKHQFSIALWADDVRYEKKNRAANEPIYFFVKGTRTPFELVVNEVGKNRITGYVSSPKTAVSSAANTSGS